MAKITRATQKLFGSSAGANQIAQFGSLNNGTPTFTTSIATIQALSNYLVGWYNAVIGGNSPAIEDMNALCYLFSYQIGYMLQEGVAEWDSGTTYYTGCIANDGTGNLYVSIQDSNTNHAVTDTTWWRITSPSGLAQYCMFVGDSNGAAQPANTSLIGDISAQYVSQAYTVTAAAPGVFTVATSPLTGQTAYVTVTQNGFTANTRYYVTKVSGTTFKLATTLANALASVNITSSSTTPGVIISGGMGIVTGSLANPMTVLGDLFYGGSTPVAGTPTRLAGDTSDTRKFLRSLSSSGTATAPAWDTLVQGDLPALSQYNVNVGDASNLPQQLNTNLLGDIKGTWLSQSYAVTSAAPGVFTVAAAPATGTSAYVTVTQNGFTASTRYYVTNVSGTTFKLATSLANALAGTNITSSGTTAGVIITGGLSMQGSPAAYGYYGAVRRYDPDVGASYTTITNGNTTGTASDGFKTYYYSTGNSNRTFTTPAVAVSAGRRIKIQKTDTGTGVLSLVLADGSLVGPGSEVPKIVAQGGVMEIECNGTNWYLCNIQEKGTFTATLGNISAGATTTWSYSRVGASVTVYNNGNASAGNYYWSFTKNGSSGVVTITGLPASILPTVSDTWVSTFQVSYNNGGTPATFNAASADIDTAQINLYRDIGADSFGASTQSSIVTSTFSYVLR